VRHLGKVLRYGAVLAALAALAAPAAIAATPQQIYRDYAANGRIDGHYSRADLQRALQDASVQGYGKPTVKPGMKAAIQHALGGGTAGSGTLPFTGFDLLFMVVGGAGLVGLGAGLRKFARSGA
jgi:opacity protein-like surface antigen